MPGEYDEDDEDDGEHFDGAVGAKCPECGSSDIGIDDGDDIVYFCGECGAVIEAS